jgi:hypothetical protein
MDVDRQLSLSSEDESDGDSDITFGLNIFPISSVLSNKGSKPKFTQSEYDVFTKFLDISLSTLNTSISAYADSDEMSLVLSNSQSRYIDILKYQSDGVKYIDNLLIKGIVFLYRTASDQLGRDFRLFVLPSWMVGYDVQTKRRLLTHIYYHMIPFVVTLIEKFSGDFPQMATFINSIDESTLRSNLNINILEDILRDKDYPKLDTESILAITLNIGEMFSIFNWNDGVYSVEYNTILK